MLASTDARGREIVAERLRAAVEALAIPHAASSCADVVTIIGRLRVVPPDARRRTPMELVAAADARCSPRRPPAATGSAATPRRRPPEPPARMASTPWRRFPPVVADPWFADRIPPFLAQHAATRSIASARGDRRAHVRSHPRPARRLRLAAGDHSIETIAELAGLLERSAPPRRCRLAAPRPRRARGLRRPRPGHVSPPARAQARPDRLAIPPAAVQDGAMSDERVHLPVVDRAGAARAAPPPSRVDPRAAADASPRTSSCARWSRSCSSTPCARARAARTSASAGPAAR